MMKVEGSTSELDAQLEMRRLRWVWVEIEYRPPKERPFGAPNRKNNAKIPTKCPFPELVFSVNGPKSQIRDVVKHSFETKDRHDSRYRTGGQTKKMRKFPPSALGLAEGVADGLALS